MGKINTALILVFSLTSFVFSQTKVACVGNSITAGNGSDTGYTARLQKLLGSTYQVQNDGKSGTTLLKHGDVPYWTRDKFPQVFTFKPDIITIKLGTNDTKKQNWDTYHSEFKKDLGSMIDTFNTLAKKPKIYLVLPVPIWEPNQWGIRDSALKKIIVIIKQVASERSLPLIDCNTPLLAFKSYFPDGVHPDDPGADTIAHTIYRAITGQTSITTNQQSKLVTPIRFQKKSASLFVSIPDAGQTVIEAFDLSGKRLGRQTFEQAGTFEFTGIGKYHGVFVIRCKNMIVGNTLATIEFTKGN